MNNFYLSIYIFLTLDTLQTSVIKTFDIPGLFIYTEIHVYVYIHTHTYVHIYTHTRENKLNYQQVQMISQGDIKYQLQKDEKRKHGSLPRHEF